MQQSNDGYTGLMYACIYGQYEICQILLDNGIDFHVTNNNGDTALDVAQGNLSGMSHMKIVELIKSHM